MKEKKFFTAGNISLLAILSAVIVVLQCFGSIFTIGLVNFSFVLVPIVLGAITIGPQAGVLLGFVFGVVTIVMGFTGADPFTNFLLADNPIGTIILCIVKATACGFTSGIIFSLLKRRSKSVALYISSASAPIVNTSIFIIGMLIMSGTLNAYMSQNGLTSVSPMHFLIITCAGINFLVELGINCLFTPFILRVVKATRRGV